MPWNKGKIGVYSEETLNSMRVNRTDFNIDCAIKLYKQGKSCNEIAKILSSNYGTVHRRISPFVVFRDKGSGSRNKKKSEDHKRKIRESNIRTFSSPKMLGKRIGKNNGFYGHKHKPESISVMKEKVSIALSGVNNPSWRGGLSFESYGQEFNDKLKDRIREVFGFECQRCFISQFELGYKLIAHHIDYNKKNNDPSNLISLCRNCHMETNFNREEWESFFLKEVAS